MNTKGLRNIMNGFLLFVTILMIFVTGSSQAQTVTNEYCPVTTTEKVDKNVFLDYKGQRIYFCCNKCRRDFMADPGAYLANLQTTDNTHGDSLTAVEAVHKEIDSTKQAAATHPDTTGKSKHDEEVGGHKREHEGNSGLIVFLGKLHPAVVHFPIALVLVALAFVVVRMIFGLERYEEMAATIIYWAAASAIAAAFLGLARASGPKFPSFLESYFLWHRALGLVTAALTTVTAVTAFEWRHSGSRKLLIAFRILLAVTAVVIGIAGHLGAALVFGPNYFSG